jgi:hypothetical protein
MFVPVKRANTKAKFDTEHRRKATGRIHIMRRRGADCVRFVVESAR